MYCRAKVSENCQKVWRPSDEDWTDSTLVGDSVVCNACYIAVEPFMRMNSDDIPAAVDVAVGHYRTNVEFLRNRENPQQLVDEATEAMKAARPGSPYYVSASALKALAEQEVRRRESQ